MGKIKDYAFDTSISDDDKVIGTDSSQQMTKNFSIAQLRQHVFNGYGAPGQILGLDAFGRLTWVDCNNNG